jgi:predicted unusual protein kinase regulating ubiquinone biosynthesis (AarF/ABC1/UbiB family)
VKEQTSIPKHKFARAASLAQTGAVIGANYAKYRARQFVGAKADKQALDEANAKATYETFSRLKGSPLKVAQMLSIDKNILPSAYAQEFQQSYYSAPPLSYPLVVQTFRREMGKSPTELFETFSRQAVAGASIGQVHRATLGGKTYAVKVQYPGVADSLKSDLKLVKPFAMRLFDLDPQALEPYLKEVEARLLEETDYALELQRSMLLAGQSADIPKVCFPKYYPELSGPRILTMDWVAGLPLDKWLKTSPSQQERDLMGQALWDFIHHQVHTLRQFHADPHPGNFLVQAGQLWVLDFGCVKALEPDFYQKYFALMDQVRVDSPVDFEQMLEDLDLLRPSDTPHMRRKLANVYYQSVQILSRPYRTPSFDFGDESYVRSIYEFSQATRKDKELEKLTSSRGDANAIYINRAFYGLYNLVASMGARIRARLPEHLGSSQPQSTPAA